MPDKIIAISRQYGSGGREIGARLAARLGIPLYNKEFIALAAKQSGIADSFFHAPEEGNYRFRDFSAGAAPSLDDTIYLAQHALIRELAARGPCVIVGRGAGGVLRQAAPLLHVFVYADKAFRARRAIEVYGDAPKRILARLDAIDRKRAAYFQFYAGMNGMQMEHYHLCIDSGTLGMENAVALIETAYYR